ncbi:S-adenosyl-L-methionine-dependent methyltransferase [Acephala macrosclerotiorum]|nr:S-adenosyl-L-methionine-dependent methyltransferase [Acephala macrosclerotiorum]
MFRTTASSRRLALLRSNSATPLRLFHKSPARRVPKATEIPFKVLRELEKRQKEFADTVTSKVPERLKARGIGAEDTVLPKNEASSAVEEEGTTAPKVRKRRVTRKIEDEDGTASQTPKRRGRARSETTKVPKPRAPSKDPVVIPDQENTIVLRSPLRPDKALNGINIRDPENVLETLKWVFETPGYVHKKLGDTKRMNVISESLCDDSIEQLKPSLEQYRGCDILDINPGTGIWSSKLHDYLKPRSHILMEPDDAAYRRLLQPLLDEPESTYKLLPTSGIIWSQLEKILSKRFLPHQEVLPDGDPRLDQPNTSLLVVANLGYNPKKPYKGFSSLAQLVIYQFLSAIKAHSLFHRYGLIRMLIWVNDDEKFNVIPRNILYRKKSAIEMEISCPRIAEIASSTSLGTVKAGRDPALDIESLRRVMKRMEENGIKTPPGRESFLMDQLSTESTEAVDRWKWDRPEFKAKMQELGEGLHIDEDGVAWGNDYEKALKYRVVASRRNHLHRLIQELRALTGEHNAIAMMEKDLAIATPEDAQAIREDLARRQAGFTERFEKLTTKNQLEFWSWADNTRCFHEQLLVWDRREAEPLRARPDEFFPHKEMALFDLQPSPQWPVLKEDFPQNDEVLEYILAQLMPTPTQSCKKGLNSLWPGALEWLTENCPSLTDPAKGGCRDLETLPVRRLTTEMYREILEAWANWPWKPSRWDIIAKIGSVHFDPDAREEDE